MTRQQAQNRLKKATEALADITVALDLGFHTCPQRGCGSRHYDRPDHLHISGTIQKANGALDAVLVAIRSAHWPARK